MDIQDRNAGNDSRPVYLGVDVAGASNTWVSALSQGDDGGLVVVHGPRLASLEAIVGHCEESNVVAAAIDAQLTIALSEENGFRTSDMELRDMLWQREGSRNWVAAATGLMAVPVRGRLLADHLSPTVGTLLETHPRASLLFKLGEGFLTPIREYKRKRDDTREQTEVRSRYTRKLWSHWSDHFGIAHNGAVEHDGALDSLVCATVSYLFHHAPGALYKLPHRASGKTGRGPFYVVAPEAQTGSKHGKGELHAATETT